MSNSGQDDELKSKLLALEFKSMQEFNRPDTKYVIWRLDEAAIGQIEEVLRAHLDEAVRMTRNQAIDDCIDVIMAKRLEDADELMRRMQALATQPKSEGERG